MEDDGIGGESVEAGGNSVEDDGIGGECMEAIVVGDGNVVESMEAGGNTVGDARRSNGDNGNRKKRGRKPGSSKGVTKETPRKTKGTNKPKGKNSCLESNPCCCSFCPVQCCNLLPVLACAWW